MKYIKNDEEYKNEVIFRESEECFVIEEILYPLKESKNKKHNIKYYYKDDKDDLYEYNILKINIEKDYTKEE